ncbi:FAD binding domain-containing protein [Sulfobacillus harzensis]|uniref:Xanthine dehydrogenase n=1 Tax=Sulfobacillus harzensis TaxID=2729629 RepID=A0A7Y0L5U5_9FIRM|nr:FAD binding domain-containing protein [Sulfobacillus harzensis]NMP23858.1 xanthine dehydrogenase [Sulfobacillus harzensis]
MIIHPFAYFRPDTIEEALGIYDQVMREGKQPVYYGGGSEILTRSRLNDGRFDAVIDLKHIPETRVHGQDRGKLRFGAGLRLTELADRDLWPFMTATADRIADHTTRGHITLGGNLMSTLPYKEALLPLLLADSSTAIIATKGGVENRTLKDLYDHQINLKPGEFLVSVTVDGNEAKAMAFRSYKMTRQDWIDYPLVTIAVAKRDDGSIRAAFSGWASYPFTSSRVNQILSETGKAPQDRAARATRSMPQAALDDIRGSREYREFVTEYTLTNILKELEDAQ